MVTHETLNNPSRVFGCISLSTFAHVALLLSFAMLPAVRIPLPYGDSTISAEFEVSKSSDATSAIGGESEILNPREEAKAKTEVIPAPVIREVKTIKSAQPSDVAKKTAAPAIATTPQASVDNSDAVSTDAFPIKSTMPVFRTETLQPEPQVTESVAPRTLPPKMVQTPVKDDRAEPTTVAALPIKETAEESTTTKLTEAPKVAAPAAQSSTGQGAVGQGSSAATSTPSDVKELSEVRQVAGNIPPTYPKQDRVSRREGEVAVLAYVSPVGTVTEAQVESTTGSESMSKSALEAVKKYRFQPGQASWVRVPFKFTLRGDEQETPSALRQ